MLDQAPTRRPASSPRRSARFLDWIHSSDGDRSVNEVSVLVRDYLGTDGAHAVGGDA